MRNVLRYLTASILLGLACWSRANAQCTFDVGGASYDLSALQALSLPQSVVGAQGQYTYYVSVCKNSVAPTGCIGIQAPGLQVAGAGCYKIGSLLTPPQTSLLPANLDPAESASPLPMQPTETQPAEKGFQLAYQGGDVAKNCPTTGRVLRIQFLCNGDVESQLSPSYENSQRCHYTVQWTTKYACIGSTGLFGGHGTLICIMFVLLAAAYFGGGTYYRVYRAGVPLGVEAVPNIDFWRELPSLVKDGIQFTLIKCKMLAQHANLNMQYDEVK